MATGAGGYRMEEIKPFTSIPFAKMPVTKMLGFLKGHMGSQEIPAVLHTSTSTHHSTDSQRISRAFQSKLKSFTMCYLNAAPGPT